MICNSGGADGADTLFENWTIRLNGKVNAFSYKTPFHKSPNKVEISEDDFNEGTIMVKKACSLMSKKFTGNYLNFLSRNWFQVKNSDVIICIEKILNPGDHYKSGSINKSKNQVIDGGAGYAIAMAILVNKPIFVFDHTRNIWTRYSYTYERFVKSDIPSLDGYTSFAGIGTSTINENGTLAIEGFFQKNQNFF